MGGRLNDMYKELDHVLHGGIGADTREAGRSRTRSDEEDRRQEEERRAREEQERQ